MPMHTFDLTTARQNFETIETGDKHAWIVRADSDVEIQIATGEIILWPAGLTGEIDVSCLKLPIKIGVRNVAASGVLQIFTSTDICLRLGSAGSAVAGGAGSYQYLFTESILAHGVINTTLTNPQDLRRATDWGTYSIFNGGVAAQFRDDALGYFGARVGTSGVGSALALHGGGLYMNTNQMPGGAALANNFQTAPGGFTRNLIAQQRQGLFFFETDSLIPAATTIVTVAGSLIVAFGIGWNMNATVAANGVGGQLGVGLVWSNEFGNNNWHLVICDTTAAPLVAIDTGVNAIGVHQLIRLEWGWLGLTPIVQAFIDETFVGSITASFGSAMSLVLTTIFDGPLGIMSGKLQVGQAGNGVLSHTAGFADLVVGRLVNT